ncbi:MAG: hypothetical protein IJ202_11605 [Bacteroidales bacterium]|nr:hypothetical protein [Bacteroidales bacterium]MBQ9712134.1 hypothetical protein [Bacteroidales bacterium]MBR1436387.1 hypothetical protein [Bacteroidales bacterium]
MKKNFTILYVLLVVAQMLLTNYFHLSSYIMLTILPVIVLCIPTRISTTACLFIAFITGISVDLLAEGMLGINALALTPVALVRRPICNAIFGPELQARNEDFSIRKYGPIKVIFAIFLAQALFLIVYIAADCGLARPFLFCLERFGASLLAGTLLSIPVADLLTPDDRK